MAPEGGCGILWIHNMKENGTPLAVVRTFVRWPSVWVWPQDRLAAAAARERAMQKRTDGPAAGARGAQQQQQQPWDMSWSVSGALSALTAPSAEHEPGLRMHTQTYTSVQDQQAPGVRETSGLTGLT